MPDPNNVFWQVLWVFEDGTAESARLESGEPDEGWRMSGGATGVFHLAPSTFVWDMETTSDWTAVHFVLVQDERVRSRSRVDTDLRREGRRWFDGNGRELPPDTRDTPFVVWRGSAFCHLPILRHIGLNSDEPRELEVLDVNVANGHCAAARRRYTPLSGGRWYVEDLNWGEAFDVRVDDDGLLVQAPGMVERRKR